MWIFFRQLAWWELEFYFWVCTAWIHACLTCFHIVDPLIRILATTSSFPNFHISFFIFEVNTSLKQKSQAGMKTLVFFFLFFYLFRVGYNSNVVLFSNYIFYLHLKSAECSCQQWPKMKLYSWNCLVVIKMCRNFNRVADISSCSVRTWKFSNLILPWLNFSDCWVIPLHSYVFFINLSSKSLVLFLLFTCY